MEKFSVLMSVYYKEKPEFFDIALESNLIKQTLPPNEFVLICDGMLTPELEFIIDKYRKLCPNILKVYRKENGGLGKALNFGLLKCTYPLVARSDSDDVCVESRFEKQVKYMELHPEVGIISSYIDEFVDDYSNPIQVKTQPLTHEELYELAKFRNPLNHMSVMMRKDNIIRLGSYRHIPYMEDYDLWVRAIINGIKIGNIGEVLVHARIGNGMVQRRGTVTSIRSLHIINKNMLQSGMIGLCTYMRNMIAIITFVFMPLALRNLLYKMVLRKS